MGLRVLILDSVERRPWTAEVVRAQDDTAITPDCPRQAAQALRTDVFDLVLLGERFPEADRLLELTRATGRTPVIGLDAAPRTDENIDLPPFGGRSSEALLQAVLRRESKCRRLLRQGASISHRATALHHLTKELQHANRRMTTLLETSRAIFAAADEERAMTETMQAAARYTHGAPCVFLVERRDGLKAKMAMGVPPEKLAENVLPGSNRAWKRIAPFETGVSVPELDDALSAMLQTERYFVLPIRHGSVPHAMLAVAALPQTVDRAALRVLVPLASLALLQKRRERELRMLAEKDGLTGLNNQEAVRRRLRLELKRHERSQAPLSLVLFDVDHFKRINDTHGHLTGDRALKYLSRIFRYHTRESDIVGRYGGEEFLILLPDTDRQGAEAKVKRLLEETRRVSLHTTGPITLSAGIATYPTDGTTAVELLGAADRALYAAKDGGRNRAMTYSEWLEESLARGNQASSDQHP
jgi:diguanylate cyclase (GGDEF)-like protein